MMAFENTEGNGENAGSQHFLFYDQCFLPYQRKKKMQHLNHTEIIVCSCFQLGDGQNLSSGKGLTLFQTSHGCYVSTVQVF